MLLIKRSTRFQKVKHRYYDKTDENRDAISVSTPYFGKNNM